MADYTEEEVHRVAKDLVRKHGAAAMEVARRNLADVRRGGDAEIIAYWREVLDAISKVQL